MPKKPVSVAGPIRAMIAARFTSSSIRTKGSSPIATIDQRKKASENGGTTPALARASTMLLAFAVATTAKPSSASAGNQAEAARALTPPTVVLSTPAPPRPGRRPRS